MISFSRIDGTEPYSLFQDYYFEAERKKQNNIEAIAIASYQKDIEEVDSRFVNLKYIEENRWFFYTNYNSPKAKQFAQSEKISALIFWNSINTQIRIKAKIKKQSHNLNQKYFEDRNPKKNALAISSEQSRPIESFERIVKNFENTFSDDNTEKSVSLEKKLIEYKLRKVYIFLILAILLLLIICLNFYD